MRTIVDELALPNQMKRIPFLQWWGDDEVGVDEVLDESGLPEEILYTYQNLLIRVIGASTNSQEATTFRKVAGNELRGVHALQEAATTVYQYVVKLDLPKHFVSP